MSSMHCSEGPTSTRRERTDLPLVGRGMRAVPLAGVVGLGVCLARAAERLPSVSYNVAVWEAEHPSDDAEGQRHFEDLYRQFLQEWPPLPPTVRIRAFVDALVARWPDDHGVGESAHSAHDSPWADRPLTGNAGGPIVYLSLLSDRAEEVIAFARELADRDKLVCFDPQASLVLSRVDRDGDAGRPVWRMITHSGRTYSRLDPALVGAALASLPRDGHVVVQNAADPDDQVYLQVWLRPNGVYQVEHRLGSEDRHYVGMTASVDKVADAVVSWIEGRAEWRAAFDWTPLSRSTWA